MRMRCFVIVGLVLSGCVPGTAAEPTLEALVAGNVAARGGAQAIERVEAFQGDLHIAEPAFEAEGVYVATRDGRMRIDITMDGNRVFTEALGRDRTWSWSPAQGVQEGTAAGAAALRHGIEFPFKLFGLHEMESRGHHLELLGRETVDGIAYHVLRLTLDDGFEVRYYLDPDSLLIERERTRRALHVDVDPSPEWIETSYSDYRPVAGVLFPYRQVERRLATGAILSTTTLRRIDINPPLTADRFTRP